MSKFSGVELLNLASPLTKAINTYEYLPPIQLAARVIAFNRFFSFNSFIDSDIKHKTFSLVCKTCKNKVQQYKRRFKSSETSCCLFSLLIAWLTGIFLPSVNKFDHNTNIFLSSVLHQSKDIRIRVFLSIKIYLKIYYKNQVGNFSFKIFSLNTKNCSQNFMKCIIPYLW